MGDIVLIAIDEQADALARRAALQMTEDVRCAGEAAFLAAAQRDLRTLESAPALVALAEEAPRIFRRYGAIDERWIAQKRARIAQLAELGRIAEGPEPAGDEGRPPWFRRVMGLVDLLHGEGAAAAVERALAQLQEGARARRAEARRALNELLLGLAGERAPTIDRAARALRLLEGAADLPGRRRDRRPPSSLPPILAIMLTSSTSPGSSGGRIPISRAASIDFPAPGGPTSIRLCAPAAAISSARLAVSCPLTSRRSG